MADWVSVGVEERESVVVGVTLVVIVSDMVRLAEGVLVSVASGVSELDGVAVVVILLDMV